MNAKVIPAIIGCWPPGTRPSAKYNDWIIATAYEPPDSPFASSVLFRAGDDVEQAILDDPVVEWYASSVAALLIPKGCTVPPDDFPELQWDCGSSSPWAVAVFDTAERAEEATRRIHLEDEKHYHQLHESNRGATIGHVLLFKETGNE